MWQGCSGGLLCDLVQTWTHSRGRKFVVDIFPVGLVRVALCTCRTQLASTIDPLCIFSKGSREPLLGCYWHVPVWWKHELLTRGSDAVKRHRWASTQWKNTSTNHTTKKWLLPFVFPLLCFHHPPVWLHLPHFLVSCTTTLTEFVVFAYVVCVEVQVWLAQMLTPVLNWVCNGNKTYTYITNSLS